MSQSTIAPAAAAALTAPSDTRSAPRVALVTAYDEYEVCASELNAVDYLLEPVDAPRLRHTLTRAHDRLERADWKATRADEAARVHAVAASCGARRRLRTRAPTAPALP